MMRVATIMTCHNRRAKTIQCLESLENQLYPSHTVNTVYLTDDGSSDGTVEVIYERFPQTRLMHGNGSLYWNGGMRVSFAAAMADDHDYYLWLNDDVILNENAVTHLLATHQTLSSRGKDLIIVIGSMKDPVSGKLTYGGVNRSCRWHPLRFRLVSSSIDARQCDTMNGNCVLIPRSVANLTGNLDEGFIHLHGDYDYGLRTVQLGGEVWIAPGFAGTCARNTVTGTWRDGSLSRRERWRHILSPKGLPPTEWLRFLRRHAGPTWPIFWVQPYLRCLFGGPLLRIHES